MMLSHCVVVRTFLVDGGSASGGRSTTDGGSAGFACAMMLCASVRAFFCASRAILVFSATFWIFLDFFVSWLAFLKSFVERAQQEVVALLLSAVVVLPYIC